MKRLLLFDLTYEWIFSHFRSTKMFHELQLHECQICNIYFFQELPCASLDNPDNPGSKVHGASMGPTWGRQDPGGPHVGPMNLAILDSLFWISRYLHPHNDNSSCWKSPIPLKRLFPPFEFIFSIIHDALHIFFAWSASSLQILVFESCGYSCNLALKYQNTYYKIQEGFPLYIKLTFGTHHIPHVTYTCITMRKLLAWLQVLKSGGEIITREVFALEISGKWYLHHSEHSFPN